MLLPLGRLTGRFLENRVWEAADKGNIWRMRLPETEGNDASPTGQGRP